MRVRDLVPGRHYAAKVSGRLVIVRLESVYQTFASGRWQWRCVVHNTRTGRMLRVSPARLRSLAVPTQAVEG